MGHGWDGGLGKETPAARRTFTQLPTVHCSNVEYEMDAVASLLQKVSLVDSMEVDILVPKK